MEVRSLLGPSEQEENKNVWIYRHVNFYEVGLKLFLYFKTVFSDFNII